MLGPMCASVVYLTVLLWGCRYKNASALFWKACCFWLFLIYPVSPSLLHPIFVSICWAIAVTDFGSAATRWSAPS